MKEASFYLLLVFLCLSVAMAGCAAPARPQTPPSDGDKVQAPAPQPQSPTTQAPAGPPEVKDPVSQDPAPKSGGGTGKKVTFRIYGATPDLMYLVPLTIEAPHPEDMHDQALRLLFAWSDKSGATVSPWPAGVKLRSLKVKDGTATVDLTGVKGSNFGSSREALALDSLTLTLTQFSHIKRVQVLRDGKVVESLAGHTDTSRPLTPPPYQNYISFGSAPPGETMPVTLYFSEPNAMYLVPVTRDIPKTKAVARAVVEELIRGPAKDSGLGPVIPEGTRLLAIKLKDGLLTVDFSKELRDKHWGGTAGEALTLNGIVHSLTALPGVDKVEILIEGQRGASIGGHVILDRPLTAGPINLLPQF